MQDNNFIFPSFNRVACEYLDSLNKDRGWNLQHALRGGEYYLNDLGYWVDGYDVNKNIVVEYDEKYHNKPSQMLRDKRRMSEIKEYLGCRFYRYSAHKNELNEY